MAKRETGANVNEIQTEIEKEKQREINSDSAIGYILAKGETWY